MCGAVVFLLAALLRLGGTVGMVVEVWMWMCVAVDVEPGRRVTGLVFWGPGGGHF
jgi:hypothetical protein